MKNPTRERQTTGMPADALKVVTDPERYQNQWMLRRLAWATLLERRGRRMAQRPVAQMQRAMAAAPEIR